MTKEEARKIIDEERFEFMDIDDVKHRLKWMIEWFEGDVMDNVSIEADTMRSTLVEVYELLGGDDRDFALIYTDSGDDFADVITNSDDVDDLERFYYSALTMPKADEDDMNAFLGAVKRLIEK